MKKTKIYIMDTVINYKKIIYVFFWFFLGVILGLFFFFSFLFIYYQNTYANKVYPGVFVNGMDFGGKTQNEVRQFFAGRNASFSDTKFVFSDNTHIASASANYLEFGYDQNLISQQVYTIGRSDSLLSNISLLVQAYINGINLPPSFHYSDNQLTRVLTLIIKQINIKPVDGLFTFSGGRVSAFRLAQDGQEVDIASIQNKLMDSASLMASGREKTILIPLTINTLKPAVANDKVNNLGIKELLASGTSLFFGSIANRIYNITLAATRLNGVLIPPNQVFSFDQALGDISAFSGYKQAYVIQNGHTVLGDGGGVCQVSTTFFRAVLNAGFPIVERHAHAYRVHYYEEDSGPGIDAAVYSPTVDLKFKNDSGNYLLIQSIVDPANDRLTFQLYGTKDGREVTIGNPVIVSQTPAPPPLYQDDPALPKGTVQQTDFQADGASVYFKREVKQNGKIIISDKFVSNYQPWQAVYLRGTQ